MHMPNRLPGLKFVIAGLFLLVAGCVTETHVDGPRPIAVASPVVTVKSPHPAVARHSSDDPADPCATRLQDMAGPLLEYYGFYGKFPAKLEDLRALLTSMLS